jgi:hypothetical protein
VAALSIAPVTLGIGDTVLPTFAMPNGWTQAVLSFDITALVSALTVKLEDSDDGSTFTLVGSVTYSPALATVADFTLGRSTSRAFFRLTLTTAIGFLSTGGGLTVS